MKKTAALLWIGFFGTSSLYAMSVKDFETYEYQRSGGLGLINASSAYLLGYTGKDVIVALMDTGVYTDHNKFKSKILPGYDIYTEMGIDTDPDGHGTHVAGIIAAHQTGRGMHGVAYEAKIIPIRIFSDNTTDETVSEYDTRMSRAIRYGFENGARISNNSWGYVENTDKGYYGVSIKDYSKNELETGYPEQLAAFREAALRYDQIFVFAAGNIYNETKNQQDPSLMGMFPSVFPEFKGHWVTVVNIDQTGIINNSSHYCGNAAEWCLAAPGTNILSTIPGGYYERMTGTSMSAPHVSGGLAVLAGAFPNLTSEQLVRRLLVTANKAGNFSNSAIYGQGLMDLRAATQPIGVLQFPIENKAYGRVKKVPRAWREGFAFSLRNSLGSRPFLVLDSFDRAPFQMSANVLFSTQPALSNNNAWQNWAETGQWSAQALKPVQWQMSGSDSISYLSYHPKEIDLSQDFLNYQQSFHPYFANNSETYTVGQHPTNHSAGFVWEAFHGTKDFQVDSHSQNGLLLGYRQPIGTGYLEWQSGTLIEENQILGFANLESENRARYTPTLWQGMQLGWQSTNKRWQLLGGWQLARTEAQWSNTAVDQSLVSFDSPLWSQTWQLAAHYENAAHCWQLALHQPIQVTSGNVHLHWPESVSADGTIHYQEEWVSLKQAPQKTIESIYQYQHSSRWSTQLIGSVTLQAATAAQYWTGLKMQYTLYP